MSTDADLEKEFSVILSRGQKDSMSQHRYGPAFH